MKEVAQQRQAPLVIRRQSYLNYKDREFQNPSIQRYDFSNEIAFRTKNSSSLFLFACPVRFPYSRAKLLCVAYLTHSVCCI